MSENSECYNRCNITLHKGSSFLDVKSMLLGKKTASQQTVSVSLTEEELATVYNLLPSGTSGALRYTLRTYSDPEYKNQIEGSGGYKEITLNIPEDAKTKPSVSMSLVPVGSLPSAFAGLFIQGNTKVKAILSAEGKYGASIKGYSMKIGSDTYGSQDNRSILLYGNDGKWSEVSLTNLSNTFAPVVKGDNAETQTADRRRSEPHADIIANQYPVRGRQHCVEDEGLLSYV